MQCCLQPIQQPFLRQVVRRAATDAIEARSVSWVGQSRCKKLQEGHIIVPRLSGGASRPIAPRLHLPDDNTALHLCALCLDYDGAAI